MKRMVKKGILIIASAIWVMTACSCLRAQTDVNIKRNGDAVITVEVLMDDESVKEKYGMPTNFYDAMEGDYRFSRLASWGRMYTSEQYDGLNYIGLKLTKEAEKKEIGDALSALYGDYANINYVDSNLFGNRTIKINVSGNGNHLQEEELQAAFAGEILSKMIVSIPGSIKSTTGNQISDDTVEIDLTPILTGETTDISVEIKFFDFTFFIPIIIAVVVIVTALVVVLSKVKKEKNLNASLTSIKLEKKPAKASKGGFGGGFGGGGMDDLDDLKPKKSSMFAKKTPKYTPSQEAPAAEAPAPVASQPAAPAAGSSSALMRRTPKPAAPAPAPVAPQPVVAPAPQPVAEPEPVYETPAPSYEEPVYEEPAYVEPEPVVEEKTSYTAGSAKASYGSTKPQYTYQAGSARSTAPVEPALVDYSEQTEAAADNSLFVPKAEYETNGLEDQTSQTMSFGSNRLKREAKEINTSTSASARISSGSSSASAGYVAGGAKFNKKEGSSALSTGGTTFSPRSTAPNFQYFVPGYHEEHGKADNVSELEKGTTVFEPRSTAPNMEYFMSGHHEEHEKADNVTELSKGNTVFEPRSTAPNIGYGTRDYVHDENEKTVADPFLKEETKTTSASTLFTPRSTAPNLAYGKKDVLDDSFGPAKDPFFEKDADVSLTDYEGSNYFENYEQANYGASYDDADSYGTGYDNAGYDNAGYDNAGYDNAGYDNAGYEESYNSGYEQDGGYYDQSAGGYYEELAPAPAQQGSIYQTQGYEASGYQSASVGHSEKSAAIKEAYGGSKLGSGAYVGGAATGATIGRSVNNVGGYVDPEMVNTSSYGSDPFAGNPLPKLGESGAGGGGLFSFDATGTFGGGAGSTQGGFGAGASSYGGQSSYGSSQSSTFGKKFSTGGTGKFDFGMASSGNRKCPFCKEPIRDDDTFCVACGAELSRPYGSF